MKKGLSRIAHLMFNNQRRTVLALGLGLLAFVALASVHPLLRLLMSWDVFLLFYFVGVMVTVLYFNHQPIGHLLYHDRYSLWMVLLLSLLSMAMVVLGFVNYGLHAPALAVDARRWMVVVSYATFLLSWLVLHLAYALLYASLYYQAQAANHRLAPLVFAETKLPRYWDFIYFSLVIGMTCQTADVNIANSTIRVIVMIQGLVAFIFNTTLLALLLTLMSSVLT